MRLTELLSLVGVLPPADEGWQSLLWRLASRPSKPGSRLLLAPALPWDQWNINIFCCCRYHPMVLLTMEKFRWQIWGDYTLQICTRMAHYLCKFAPDCHIIWANVYQISTLFEKICQGAADCLL